MTIYSRNHVIYTIHYQQIVKERADTSAGDGKGNATGREWEDGSRDEGHAEGARGRCGIVKTVYTEWMVREAA